MDVDPCNPDGESFLDPGLGCGAEANAAVA